MIQPLLDIMRAHLCVGSGEHGVRVRCDWNRCSKTRGDLAPKALAEWRFLDLLGQEAARAISRPLREGCWRRCRAGGTSVDTRATSVRSSHVCSRARLEHRIACVDAGYQGRMRERLVGPDRRLMFQWGGGLVRVLAELATGICTARRLRIYAVHAGKMQLPCTRVMPL